jgi:hypothetical protein
MFGNELAIARWAPFYQSLGLVHESIRQRIGADIADG